MASQVSCGWFQFLSSLPSYWDFQIQIRTFGSIRRGFLWDCKKE